MGIALRIAAGVWLCVGGALVGAYLGRWAVRLLGGIAASLLVAVGLMWRPATGRARWRWGR